MAFLRQYHGAKHFARDLRLSLDTPCYEVVVLRRKTSNDTDEPGFGAQSSGYLLAGQSGASTGARISDFVEEGPVEYVSVHERSPTGSGHPTRSSASGIGEKRKTPVKSSPLPRPCFQLAGRSTTPRKQSCVFDSGFGAALDREASGSRGLSERDRRAAPVFQVGRK